MRWPPAPRPHADGVVQKSWWCPQTVLVRPAYPPEKADDLGRSTEFVVRPCRLRSSALELEEFNRETRLPHRPPQSGRLPSRSVPRIPCATHGWIVCHCPVPEILAADPPCAPAFPVSRRRWS